MTPANADVMEWTCPEERGPFGEAAVGVEQFREACPGVGTGQFSGRLIAGGAVECKERFYRPRGVGDTRTGVVIFQDGLVHAFPGPETTLVGNGIEYVDHLAGRFARPEVVVEHDERPQAVQPLAHIVKLNELPVVAVGVGVAVEAIGIVEGNTAITPQDGQSPGIDGQARRLMRDGQSQQAASRHVGDTDIHRVMHFARAVRAMVREEVRLVVAVRVEEAHEMLHGEPDRLINLGTNRQSGWRGVFAQGPLGAPCPEFSQTRPGFLYGRGHHARSLLVRRECPHQGLALGTRYEVHPLHCIALSRRQHAVVE